MQSSKNSELTVNITMNGQSICRFTRKRTIERSNENIQSSRRSKRRLIDNSKFKLLPIELMHLIALYLNVNDIVSFGNMNNRMIELIIKSPEFIRTLISCRLTSHRERIMLIRFGGEIIPVDFRPQNDNDVAILNIFREMGYSVNIFREMMTTNIHQASAKGYDILLKRLIKGHRLNYVHSCHLPEYQNEESALDEAARRGYLDIVQILVDYGVSFDRGCSSPLDNACVYGHLEIVKYLVSKGAHVWDSWSRDFTTSKLICHIIQCRKFAVLEFLIRHDLDGKNISGQTLNNYQEILVKSASQSAPIELIEYLLSKGVEIRDSDRLNIIKANISHRDFEKVKYFINYDLKDSIISAEKAEYYSDILRTALTEPAPAEFIKYMLSKGIQLSPKFQ